MQKRITCVISSVEKQDVLVIAETNGTTCVISSDAEIDNYPLYKQMVEEVRREKERINMKDDSPSGITLAAGIDYLFWKILKVSQFFYFLPEFTQTFL